MNKETKIVIIILIISLIKFSEFMRPNFLKGLKWIRNSFRVPPVRFCWRIEINCAYNTTYFDHYLSVYY